MRELHRRVWAGVMATAICMGIGGAAMTCGAEGMERSGEPGRVQIVQTGVNGVRPTLKPTGPEEKPVVKPGGTGGKPTNKPTGKPVDKPAGKPTDKPTGQQTDKPAGKPAGKPTDRPAVKRDELPLPSYGLRVLAARDELVFAGLCGNEITLTDQDFCRAMNLSELQYITIKKLPDPAVGTLFVGSVGAAEGQVITAGSLKLLSYAAADDRKPSEARMEVSVNGSGYAMTCHLCLLDRVNYTPTVSLVPDVTLQVSTYRQVAVTGNCDAYDPEGDQVTYEIVRYAAHGRVRLTDRHTGAYTYTPDSAYVGQDSFEYVVRDRFGNYSTAATVHITVRERPAAVNYADLNGHPAANAMMQVAEWGLMNGKTVGDAAYFQPAEGMSRADFLVTAMHAAGIGETEVGHLGATSFADNEKIPVSMRKYVAYAQQKQYISGRDVDGQRCFCPDEIITRAEAAVILSNIIGYANETTVSAFADADQMPAWSADALISLRALGILVTPDGGAHARDKMTRADTAVWLSRTVQVMRG